MRAHSVVAVAIAALLALTACGGQDSPATGTTTPATAAPSPTGATTPATAAPSPTGAATTPATASPDPSVAACSAAGMDTSGFTENPDLTGQANQTRRDIAAAAASCDYDRLAALAGDEFSYSFGDSSDPASFWRRQEAQGEPVLHTLVTLLGLDVHVAEATGDEDPLIGTLYTWPRAYQAPTDAARSELEEAFDPTRVAPWYTPDGEYLGWRVGIRGDGAWLFLVAGD